MKISVIIPTYNRLGQLKRVLSGLENQNFQQDEFEVLVISDGSSDGTDEYLRTTSVSFHLRPFFQANQGPAAARNLGISQAAGEIVLFIDDDVFPLPDLIEQHLRYHNLYGDCAVVIGPMLAPPDCRQSPWVRWEAERLLEQYQAMTTGKWAATARQFYTGNSSLARLHLIASGGFNPSFRRAEDVELAYRLARKGLQFFFNPLAAGYHYAERSLASWSATPYSYGRNDVIFSEQSGQEWILRFALKGERKRHFLIRVLVWICLSRPLLSHVAFFLLQQLVSFGEKFHFDTISSSACSAMFNLHYYQGIADQLTSRQAFFHKLRESG